MMAMPSLGNYTNASPQMRAFLAAHPVFAAMTSVADRQRFLANHPDINDVYQRIVTATSAPTPAATSSPTATAPVTSVADPGPTADQLSAKGLINGALTAYGLSGLGDWAWQQYLAGTPTSQIMLDLRARPEYKARFPGMDALSANGRAISEDQYISLERSYVQTARAYGLPADFYDSPDDFGKLIAADVSPQEYEQRLQLASRYAATDPQAQRLRDTYAAYYGPIAGQGAAIAYMIDPAKGLDVLQKQHEAAQAGALAAQTGFGSLTRDNAERIGALGLSADSEASTFSKLGSMASFKVATDQGDQAVSDEDLIAAGFEQNATAQAKIEKTRQRRLAQFQGGGGYATSQRGVSGLGSAAT